MRKGPLQNILEPVMKMLAPMLGNRPKKGESVYDDLEDNPWGLIMGSFLNLFKLASNPSKDSRTAIAAATPKAILGVLLGFFSMLMPKNIVQGFKKLVDPILGNFFKPEKPKASKQDADAPSGLRLEEGVDSAVTAAAAAAASSSMRRSRSVTSLFDAARAAAPGLASDTVSTAMDLARTVGLETRGRIPRR